jgi:hypothetical protein
MEFKMIHDVYSVETEEVIDQEGNPQEMEVEKLIKEDVETSIYLEVDDITVIMPFYNKHGVHLKDRSIVRAHGDNFVIRGSFEELKALKLNNNKPKIGFRHGKIK